MKADFGGLLLILILSIGLQNIVSASDTANIEQLPAEHSKRKEIAEKYFRQYGYYGPLSPDPTRNVNTVNDVMMTDMTREFQIIADIPVTGQLDDHTMAMMLTPRCGVPDKVTIGDTTRRKKRFVLQGSKWGKTNLTYAILSYTKDLPKESVDMYIEQAFETWANMTPLIFSQTTEESADIKLRFVTKEHGDGMPFDGPKGTMAHSFFPSIVNGGEIHFDDDEIWNMQVSTGVSLYQVAVHGFGHILGLGHSQNKDSMMYAFYMGYKEDAELSSDDIAGAHRVYGRPRWWKRRHRHHPRPRPRPRPRPHPHPRPTHRPWPVPTTPHYPTTTYDPWRTTTRDPWTTPSYPPYHTTTKQPWTGPTTTPHYYTTTRHDYTTTHGYPTTTSQPPTKPPKPELCTSKNPGIDAIMSLPEGVYVFSGSEVYVLDDYGIEPGYPVSIAHEFPGIPDDLDAVLYWKEEEDVEVREPAKIFFFKGNLYWRYDNGTLSHGYPRLISEGFPGLPNDIDAAFVWGLNGYTYFIKDDQYYKYYRQTMAGSPKPLSKWYGLPNRVGAAMLHQNGRTYFFEKDSDNYYRFNDYHFKVDQGYPKSARRVWYDCDYYEHDFPEFGAELESREEGLQEGEAQFLKIKAEEPENATDGAMNVSFNSTIIATILVLLFRFVN